MKDSLISKMPHKQELDIDILDCGEDTPTKQDNLKEMNIDTRSEDEEMNEDDETDYESEEEESDYTDEEEEEKSSKKKNKKGKNNSPLVKSVVANKSVRGSVIKSTPIKNSDVVSNSSDTTQWTMKKSSTPNKVENQTSSQDSKTQKITDSSLFFSFSQKHSNPNLSPNSSNSAPQGSVARLATIKPGNGTDFFSKFLYKPNKNDNEFDQFLNDDSFLSKPSKPIIKPLEPYKNKQGTPSTPDKVVKLNSTKNEEDDDNTDQEDSERKVKKVKLTNTHEEEEEIIIVNKKARVVNQNKTTTNVVKLKTEVVNIEDEEEDTDKEEEEEVVIDGQEVEQVEEEEEEEDDDESTTIDRLINACEAFSKKMFEILSSFDPNNKNNNNNNSNNNNNNLNNSKSDLIEHKIIYQPKLMDIKDSMRSYQLIGLNWLSVLYKENINGILADEMGLGKTVQTISLLAHIYENFEDFGPHLIIVPATTLSNWERELKRWCSKLKVFTYYGSQKEREHQRSKLRSMEPGKDFNIIVTTYNVLYNNMDRGFLKSKFLYSYMILDEAQNIKNADSKRYKHIFRIESRHRLLLTGTPLQNNLYELWSLLNFLMPHIFGDSSKNNALLTQLLGVNDKNSKIIIDRMKKILSPFILRRLKSTVSQELLPKVEFIEHCKMGSVQEKMYNDLVLSSKTQINDLEKEKEADKLKENTNGKKRKSRSNNDDAEISLADIDEFEGKKGGKKSSRSYILQNIIMQLRKLANHPLLMKRVKYTDKQVDEIIKTVAKLDFYEGYSINDIKELFQDYSDFDIHCVVSEQPKLQSMAISDHDIIELSTKSCRLRDILKKEILENKSKVLIFSQMTKVLDILEKVLDIMGFSYCRLDGSTSVTNRQDIIDLYSNSEDIPIFLLSTLAGGLGINLTCANVVIFYDSSFNPQVDRQAEDRAHRLGQTKEVRIYKLIAQDTVDDHINNLSNEKKKLNDSMLEEGTYAEQASESKLESKIFVKMLDQFLNKS